MFIGTCGFGSSGSSAVSDYLKEFNENCVLDRIEFTIPFCVDGLTDLDYHLHNATYRCEDSIAAIDRFKKLISKQSNYLTKRTKITKQELSEETEKFLNKLIQARWLGYSGRDDGILEYQIGARVLYARVRPFFERKLGIRYKWYPLKTVSMSILPDGFDDAAKEFLHFILEKMGADFSRNIVLDQPFSGNNPQACFNYYDDPRAIVVDRDPRDNYIFAKTTLKGKNTFMPTESVEEFIKYYKALRVNQPYTKDDTRILRLQFEDLVYKYDETTELVRNWLGLPKNPSPKSIFDPALSIANTQTFKRFPQFTEDVKKIEKALPEYIYDFSRYPEPDLSGKMFYGKSPKNM